MTSKIDESQENDENDGGDEGRKKEDEEGKKQKSVINSKVELDGSESVVKAKCKDSPFNECVNIYTNMRKSILEESPKMLDPETGNSRLIGLTSTRTRRMNESQLQTIQWLADNYLFYTPVGYRRFKTKRKVVLSSTILYGAMKIDEELGVQLMNNYNVLRIMGNSSNINVRRMRMSEGIAIEGSGSNENIQLPTWVIGDLEKYEKALNLERGVMYPIAFDFAISGLEDLPDFHKNACLKRLEDFKVFMDDKIELDGVIITGFSKEFIDTFRVLIKEKGWWKKYEKIA